MSEPESWGQLVSLTDIYSEPIQLTTDKYSIGRLFDCDLCLSENKLVSGHHCHLTREKDGRITLTDTSTNGTLLNMTYKVTKGKTKELQHGDEFYIVFKKNNEELNVGYIFQDVKELQKEEGTQEYSPPDLMDATLEDSGCNYITPEKVNNKRKSTEDTNEIVEAKRAKIEQPDNVKKETEVEENNSDKTKDSVSEEKESDKDENKCSKESSEVTTATTSKPSTEEKDDIEENLICMICQEIMHECISLQPCLHSFCGGCYSDWMKRSQECPSCRNKVERINKNHIVNNLIEAYLKVNPGKRRPEEDLKELDNKNKINLDLPFPKHLVKEDSSDYSDSDNSDGNNDEDDDDDDGSRLAPTFFPAQAPQPVLFGIGAPIFGVNRGFKTVCRQCPDYKEPADGAGIIGGIKTAFNNVKNIITGAGNQDNNTTTAGTSNAAADPGTSGGEPSTSGVTPGTGEPAEAKPTTSDDGVKPFKDDRKEMPTPPDLVCGPFQNHALCQCCLQPFPDHRFLGNLPDGHAPITCGICYRLYCHAYWGCRKADCLGCLNKFKEMNFGRKALVGIILDNQFESEIFRDYIDSKELSVKDVLQMCCNEMDAGRFTVTAQVTHQLTSVTPVCYACGLNSFKQLALQLRKTLKREDLPPKAQNRPDCYWGSKCRTQKNKPHHARNFNHICDQTRQF